MDRGIQAATQFKVDDGCTFKYEVGEDDRGAKSRLNEAVVVTFDFSRLT